MSAGKKFILLLLVLFSTSAALVIWATISTGRRAAATVAEILYTDFTKMYECHQELLSGRLAMCRVENRLGVRTIRFDLGYPDEFVDFALTGLRAEVTSPHTSPKRVSHYMSIIVRYNGIRTRQIA